MLLFQLMLKIRKHPTTLMQVMYYQMFNIHNYTEIFYIVRKVHVRLLLDAGEYGKYPRLQNFVILADNEEQEIPDYYSNASDELPMLQPSHTEVHCTACNA